MQEFLFQASIYLLAAVIAVPLAARLGLGSVLGYLTAGIVIGPVLGLTGSETQDVQHFAEFGVVMMLFIIGLELEPRTLWDMRHRLIGLGGLQIGLTTLAVMAGAQWLGFYWSVALAIGMVVALSSTAIVLQTLSEKGLIQTGGGRSAFSVLLTQDIAVIPMLAVLPLLALPGALQISPQGNVMRAGDMEQAADEAHHAMSLVEGLPAWGVTLVTLAVVVGIILAGIYLTRPIFAFIHHARLREMYTALALLIVLGIALLMQMVGLSPALGAFLAGVVLANSEFRHELEGDIEPFKGLLLGLFFITVGAGINFGTLWSAPVTLIGLTLALILVKGAILYMLALAFRLRGRDKWLFTLSLAQAGEFGFVLLSFSVQQSVIPRDVADRLLLIVALSMLITPLLFILYEWLSRHMGDDGTAQPEDEIDEQGPVIIAGIGRFGQIVNRLVQSSGFRTVVLDHDMETIQLMRKFGFKGFFGDPTRPELLHAAGLAEAKVLVAALDDPAATTRLVGYARRERPDLHIIARAHDRTHVFELYQAGADDIVREMFDSSLRAGRYVLEHIGLSEYEAAEAERVFYHHDRETVRELAQLWDPDIPASQNEPYIARARELERELEAALAQLEVLRDKAEGDPPPG
ncbi:monovalent cation:H+ antiporter-2, CPA2 family [Lutimaribacter pacificus]|uniref:Kef-type potassium/proton antiporter, CPA2 family n=1 Tax=Lutimaribacter pacificus TaxID=391948 RepID=A0A1H0JHB1_9RHOB|nr:monovalent cation:proton antiporter-2 (CPA2) family protein [Lutimaribacter pacificus]SDO42751.1 monovalent cation:H+ antiporter-2, CPA2 family [Lutimaribacter pacificus]SHK10482.1 Kef-type potassium/proton antiporter, CPA2 family [Lutimaribacter pacificus]